MRRILVASRIVSSECCSDSMNSSSDDMGHQKYTDVIHPATPMIAGAPDDPDQTTPTDTGGHQRTPDGRLNVTEVTPDRAVLQSRTRSKQSLSATTGLPISQRR